jgi:hypothetical protein
MHMDSSTGLFRAGARPQRVHKDLRFTMGLAVGVCIVEGIPLQLLHLISNERVWGRAYVLHAALCQLRVESAQTTSCLGQVMTRTGFAGWLPFLASQFLHWFKSLPDVHASILAQDEAPLRCDFPSGSGAFFFAAFDGAPSRRQFIKARSAPDDAPTASANLPMRVLSFLLYPPFPKKICACLSA